MRIDKCLQPTVQLSWSESQTRQGLCLPMYSELRTLLNIFQRVSPLVSLISIRDGSLESSLLTVALSNSHFRCFLFLRGRILGNVHAMGEQEKRSGAGS